jgi:hypothetical protein
MAAMTSNEKMELVPSIDDPVTLSQCWFLANKIDELNSVLVKSGQTDFAFQPEYFRFLEAANVCGFVCNDIYPPDAKVVFDHFLTDPDDVINAEFSDLKQVVHFIVRSEHWGSAGGEIGAGALFKSLEVGLLQIIGKKLHPPPKPHDSEQLDEDEWHQMDLLLPK